MPGFDRDDEFFATAGVGKRIKIYEYAALEAASHVGSHYPVLEVRGGAGAGVSPCLTCSHSHSHCVPHFSPHLISYTHSLLSP